MILGNDLDKTLYAILNGSKVETSNEIKELVNNIPHDILNIISIGKSIKINTNDYIIILENNLMNKELTIIKKNCGDIQILCLFTKGLDSRTTVRIPYVNYSKKEYCPYMKCFAQVFKNSPVAAYNKLSGKSIIEENTFYYVYYHDDYESIGYGLKTEIKKNNDKFSWWSKISQLEYMPNSISLNDLNIKKRKI